MRRTYKEDSASKAFFGLAVEVAFERENKGQPEPMQDEQKRQLFDERRVGRSKDRQ